jgi:hypothetical protein
MVPAYPVFVGREPTGPTTFQIESLRAVLVGWATSNVEVAAVRTVNVAAGIGTPEHP